VAFPGDTLAKIKPRDFERAGLKAVSATDALFFVDDHRPLGKLGNGPDRANSGTGRLDAVLTGPVHIGLSQAVFGVDEQIDHGPVIGREIRLLVSDELIPFHFFAGRHTTFASDASRRINQFSVPSRLCVPNARRPQGRVDRGAGQKFQKVSSVYFFRPLVHFSAKNHVLPPPTRAGIFDGRNHVSVAMPKLINSKHQI
jgi:hypothetical protein